MKHFVTIGAVLIVLQLMVCQTAAAQTFSVENTSLDVLGGVPPGDDILAPSFAAGVPPGLVLPGIGGAGGLTVDVDGFTFGRDHDFDPQTSIVDFSVDAFAVGVAASDVAVQAGVASGEQNYDVYRTNFLTAPGTNVQIHDGDGIAVPGVPYGVAPLGMAEPQTVIPNPLHPGVDGYDSRSTPGRDIYWSWESRTPPGWPAPPAGGSLSGADVMISAAAPGYDGAGTIFASSLMLGLDGAGLGADNIDALEVFDFGTIGTFDPGLDLILFSLDPFSPSLGVGPFTPGDVLFSTGGGAFGLAIPAGALGLSTAPGAMDNLTALSDSTESDLPVELGSVEASTSGSHVILRWETASETNNAGFFVEGQRSQGTGHRSQVTGHRWEELGFVEGAGTTNTPRAYTYRTRNLEPGTWNLRLKQIDFDGAFEYSETVEATVTLPDQFVLESAYPNPFNPSTTIRFAVASEQPVTMTLSDATGRVVRTLYAGTPAASEMLSVRIDANGLASGIYLVRLKGDGFVTTEMVTLLR